MSTTTIMWRRKAVTLSEPCGAGAIVTPGAWDVLVAVTR